MWYETLAEPEHECYQKVYSLLFMCAQLSVDLSNTQHDVQCFATCSAIINSCKICTTVILFSSFYPTKQVTYIHLIRLFQL